MASPTTIVGSALVVYFSWKLLSTPNSNARGLPTPPGPKPLPVIGNLLDAPKDFFWLTYDKWTKQYGDIVSINVFGQTIIILGSLQATNDLFEKRSSIYSDRVRLPMIMELMGYEWNVALMRYTNRWRRHRRTFHQYFNQNAVHVYQPVQLREARALVQGILDDPTDFYAHLKHTFTSMSMDITYGIQIDAKNDNYEETAELILDSIIQTAVPGGYLVDLMPILKYVPSWFPGASFKRKAAKWRVLGARFVNEPFNAVKAALSRGEHVRPSMVSSLLQKLPEEHDDEDEEIIKNTAGLTYAAGADTTLSALETFFLAMVLYPDVQKRAQAELDRVVGSSRLPGFDDRKDLPYLNAIVKETMRWQPVTPLAVVHSPIADDVYKGYFIPKGSIIFGNSWTILQDPIAYPNPKEYKPERFLKDGQLDPNVQDPDLAAFGFGRRICPGRHFSNSTLFIFISSILSVFDITPPLDEQGKPIQLSPEMTTGLISHPSPFKCTIKPRSVEAVGVIREPLVEE
ncbi:hypothetical protein JAAARDRAFT_33833 [Jaapia argillacea MUCL 33604]|uniref:Cytochrome P450 n=1 Tax=Jaapia argillacea MUCL 33604 TaxID=933084 RepID=A0A067PYY2_9AGAM|nr:hypothetical protein JAAARDRAFT_33833 [Jaapia argillacea MUCL 33604]